MKETLSSSPASTVSSTRPAIINARLLAETGLLFVVFALLANRLGPEANRSGPALFLYLAVLLAQGLILQRIYIIAHEAAHRKLAARVQVNDLIGQIVLTTIFVPLQIYRKIHQFHHGFNRKNVYTSALDVFISPWPITPAVKATCYGLWYMGVFAGGLFLHSLVSIVLFLFMPVRVARKISPAFRNWSNRDRAIAWAQFGGAVVLQAGFAYVLGGSVWLFTFGLPLLAFAWIWSLLVYVFHYRTTLGEPTRYNVRAIRAGTFSRWWLMNFNQHATHHMYPHIPWYELPAQARELPAAFAAKNKTAKSLWQAVTNQLHGPLIVYRQDANPLPQFFVHWED